MSPSRAAGPRFRPTAIPLEDRVTPATFNASIDPAVDQTGAIAELIGFVNTANSNGDAADTINLLPGRRYVFQTAAPGEEFDGGTALPAIQNDSGLPAPGPSLLGQTVTLNGNGSTFFRPDGAESFRFLRAHGRTTATGDGLTPTAVTLGIPTLVVNGLTLTGGNVYDFGSTDRVIPGALAKLSGGAVIADSANLAFSDCLFLNNTATENGGAVRIRTAGDAPPAGFATSATFANCLFEGNIAGLAGGAIFATQEGGVIRSDVTLTNGSIVRANTALTGAGGIDGVTYEVFLEDTQILANRGDVGGVAGSIVDLERTLVRDNVSTGSGPGGAIARDQMLRVRNSTIAFNTSSGATLVGQTGGLAVEIINSTITNNTGGTAAIVATRGEVVLTFATVTDNIATTGNSGGVLAQNNIITISRSVVTGGRSSNVASANANLQAALFRNLGFNFIGVAPTNFPVDPTDQVGRVGNELDPLLGPLANYGGPTPTRVPAAGSPLLNRGGVPEATRLGFDQRGLPRNVGGLSDIGAIEVQAGEPQPNASPLLPVDAGVPDDNGGGGGIPTGPASVLAVGPGASASTAEGGGILPGRLGQAGPGATAANTPPSTVTLRNADGTTRLTLSPFGAIAGGIRTAAADFNGDGQADLLAGTGPGVPAQVKVLDGVTGNELFSFSPFGPFTGGVYVAAGDVNADGTPDFVVTPDEGGGPRVLVVNGKGFTTLADFFGIQDPSFTGGARPAVGDINGDGAAEVIVAAGFGGGPRVTIWDGRAVTNGATTLTDTPLSNFFAFEAGLRNGTFVAAGDVNGDGFADLVLGGGPGGGPRVRIADGIALLQAGNFGSLDLRLDLQIGNFFAGDPNSRGGVRVAAKNLDGDALLDVVTGSGVGAGSTVLGFAGSTISGNATPTTILSFEAYPGFTGGVFVG